MSLSWPLSPVLCHCPAFYLLPCVIAHRVYCALCTLSPSFICCHLSLFFVFYLLSCVIVSLFISCPVSLFHPLSPPLCHCFIVYFLPCVIVSSFIPWVLFLIFLICSVLCAWSCHVIVPVFICCTVSLDHSLSSILCWLPHRLSAASVTDT